MKIRIAFHTNWFVEGDLIKPEFTEQRVYRVLRTKENDVEVEPVYEHVNSDFREGSLWEKVAHEITTGDAMWEDTGDRNLRKIELISSVIL